MKQPYFIVSCARSGSSALVKIFEQAINGVCAMEPEPRRTSRDVLERVRKHLGNGHVYGEKNLTYAPLIEKLHQEVGAKFVWAIRDGRDVVRALMRFHYNVLTVYCDAPDEPDPQPRHFQHLDAFLPRPNVGDRFYEQWPEMTRFERCCYYWAYINELYLNRLNRLPAWSWKTVSFSPARATEIHAVAEWLGLEGLTEEMVKATLDSNVNSLEFWGLDKKDFPAWQDWPEIMQERFNLIAGGTMMRLGFYEGGV